MAPVKIQLAIQGGGAKLVCLLAAMETIQDLQSKKRIIITHISGTSAGSIAGCLLAAEVPISSVKQRLKNISK
jgi:predicted acylesterase/phospholipase RssA